MRHPQNDLQSQLSWVDLISQWFTSTRLTIKMDSRNLIRVSHYNQAR